jgi:hypothetical protein
MRLQRGLLQQRAHMRKRNGRYDLAMQHFRVQFAMGPMCDGTVGKFRRFASQREDLRDLFGGECATATGARSIGEKIANCLAKFSRVGTFKVREFWPSIAPPLPPNAHLIAIQPDLNGDIGVELFLERHQNNVRALRNRCGLRARGGEFLKNPLLFFGDEHLRSLSWHCFQLLKELEYKLFQSSARLISGYGTSALAVELLRAASAGNPETAVAKRILLPLVSLFSV